MRKAEGGNELTWMQIENIRKGRGVLFALIRDLASARPKHAAVVERALRDVHPRTEYCNSMLIRDVADVCVTLNRVEQRRRRSDDKKHTDALLLVEFLKDEFSG